MIWAGHVVVIAVDGLEKRIQTNQEILSLNLHLEVLWIIAMDGQEFFEFWSTVSSASDLVFSKLVEKNGQDCQLLYLEPTVLHGLDLIGTFQVLNIKGPEADAFRNPNFWVWWSGSFQKYLFCFCAFWLYELHLDMLYFGYFDHCSWTFVLSRSLCMDHHENFTLIRVLYASNQSSAWWLVWISYYEQNQIMSWSIQSVHFPLDCYVSIDMRWSNVSHLWLGRGMIATYRGWCLNK